MESAVVTGNILRIMDRTGDSEIGWDPAVEAEVAGARASFDLYKKKGYLAYRVKGAGEKGEVLREFDPTARKIIMSPPLVGG